MILYLGWEMFRIFRRPFRTTPHRLRLPLEVRIGIRPVTRKA